MAGRRAHEGGRAQHARTRTGEATGRASRPSRSGDRRKRDLHAFGEERALTILLNGLEIETITSLTTDPAALARGFLLNRGLLGPDEAVTAVEHDADLGVVVVRTAEASAYEARQRSRLAGSGCAFTTTAEDLAESNALPPPGRSGPRIRLEAAAELAALARPAGRAARAGTCTAVFVSGGKPVLSATDRSADLALDGIAGQLADRPGRAARGVLVTGGALDGMAVLKALRMGVPLLVGTGMHGRIAGDLATLGRLTAIAVLPRGRTQVMGEPARIAGEPATDDEKGKRRRAQTSHRPASRATSRTDAAPKRTTGRSAAAAKPARSGKARATAAGKRRPRSPG
ncbi:MAG: formate dehydrogenase accessory sulfurtransferase FdhD [Hyphomicrobiaceae bacterium]